MTFAGARGATEGFRNWDPEKGPLVPWLRDQIDSVMDALANSATHKREQRFSPESEEYPDEVQCSGSLSQSRSDDETPLEILLGKERRLEAKEQLSALFEEISDDPELEELVEAIWDGCRPEPRFLAEYLSVPVKNINNRNKRLHRRVEKVMGS